jgi:hypothetical protein
MSTKEEPMKHRRLGMAAMVTGIGALVAVPTTAGATVYERLQVVDEPYSDSYTCTSTFSVDGVFDGRLLIRQGTGPATGTFPVLEGFSYLETHTNTSTGLSFTVRGNGIFNEVTARPVDGTVVEFRAVQAGQPLVIEDGDGDVVLRDRGTVQVTYQFDTLGDGEPGGIYLEDTWVETSRGQHPSEAADFDFCALAESLTAG